MQETEFVPLRERRHRETRTLLHRATLDLFETQGGHETTVNQIAARAGISARTFFRYFPTKEEALLPDLGGLRDVIDGLRIEADSLSGAVAELARAMIGHIRDETPDEQRDHVRVMRLLAREPELRAVFAVQEQELGAGLQRALGSRLPHEGDTAITLAAELLTTAWRVGWTRWEAQSAAGGRRTPSAVHEEVWHRLREMFA